MRRSGASTSLAAWRPAVLGLGRLLSIGISTVAAAPLSSENKPGSIVDNGPGQDDGTPLWIMGVASIALTLIGGVFAGLTIA